MKRHKDSLYLWAQKDPPTGFNHTNWMLLLDDECQQRVWEASNRHRGLVVVRSQGILEFWNQGRKIDDRPLVRHILEEFRTDQQQGDYEIMVRKH